MVRADRAAVAEDPVVQADPAGGRGGPGGRGDFAIGGRGGRQNAYNATANYTFGGSILDAAPYQLRADSPAGRAPYNRQNFGGTVRRTGQDPRHLRRHAPDQLHGQLQRQSRRRALRSIRHRPHRGDARRQLQRRVGPADRSAHRPADRRQSDPAGGAERDVAGAAPLHSVAKPSGADAELPLHDDDRFDRRQLQRPDHAQLHVGAGRARRRRARRFRRTGRTGRTRRARPAGHGRDAQRAGAISAERQRAHQRLPDARRSRGELEPLAARLAEHQSPPHDAHGVVHPVEELVADRQSVCERPGRRRQRRHHRRRDGPVRLGRSRPLVHQPVERARSRSLETNRQAHFDGLHLDAADQIAHAAARRRLPVGCLQQPHRPERPRGVHLHGPVRLRRRNDRTQRQPRLRRFPARVAAAGQPAVRAGQRRPARPIDEPVRPGRLAQVIDADLQSGTSLRAAVAVHREGRPDGQPRRGAGFLGRVAGGVGRYAGRTPARSHRR